MAIRWGKKTVIGGEINRPKTKKHKKVYKSPVVLLSFLAIGLLIVGAGLRLSGKLDKYNDSQEVAADSKQVTKENFAKVTSELDAKANSGDLEGSLNEFDERISETSDDEVKYDLLLSKAVLAINNKNYDSAIGALTQAESIKGGHRVFGNLALAYESKGDNKKASEYYQKAAEDQEPLNYRAGVYEKKAQELGGNQ